MLLALTLLVAVIVIVVSTTFTCSAQVVSKCREGGPHISILLRPAASPSCVIFGLGCGREVITRLRT